MKKIYLSTVIALVFLCNTFGQSSHDSYEIKTNSNEVPQIFYLSKEDSIKQVKQEIYIKQHNKNIKLEDSIIQVMNNATEASLSMALRQQDSLNQSINYISQGKEKYLAKDYLNAISFFDKALVMNPNNKTIYYNRGICKLTLSDNQNACLDFKKAVELGYKKAVEMVVNACQ